MRTLKLKNKIRGLIKNLTFKNKLIYIYIVGIVIPVFMLCFVYCLFAISNTRESMKQELEYDIAEIGSSIDTCIDQSLGIINSIYYDTELMNILKMKNGSLYDYFNAARQIDLISRYNIQYDFIEKIIIYSYNNELYKSASLLSIDNIKKDSEWYNIYLKKNKDFSIISYKDTENNKQMLSFIRRLDYTGGQDILKFDISCSYIEKQLEYTKFNCNLWLIDQENDSVVAGSVMNKLDFPDYTVDYIERELSFPDNYSVFCDYRIKIMSNRLLLIFLISVVTVLFLALFVILLLMKPILLRFDILTTSIEDIQHERFVKISEKYLANDELGKLIRCYNRAIDRIDFLINKEYAENMKRMELENEKNKAKFALLIGQINPHFMFNILEIMRMNLIKKGDKKVSQLIYEMSMILRNIISWKTDLIKLRQEIEVVRAYLDLSNYGFENGMEINIDISEEALECIIPKMSVQIFVENAISHGLEDVLYKRKIDITADIHDYRLIICVADNGIGMSTELVNAINDKKIEDSSMDFGIGIPNVIERLRIYYGENASVKAQSTCGEGTSFTLDIPISTNKEGTVC